MHRLLLAIVLASCAAPTESKPAPAKAAPAKTDAKTADPKAADPKPAPTTANPAVLTPPTPQPVSASWSARFDASLLCKSIPDAKAALGDASDAEVGAFGATESFPPMPSTVRKVVYRFAAGKILHVAEMTAKLADIGPLELGGKTIAADAKLEAIVALDIEGCGELQINEGANVLTCTAGDIELTFVRGGPIADAPVEVRAKSNACES